MCIRDRDRANKKLKERQDSFTNRAVNKKVFQNRYTYSCLLYTSMFSIHGIFYLINSFIFSICATTIALFIGNIVSNKNAISGIVNVIALGSSFLCGAFVPME